METFFLIWSCAAVLIGLLGLAEAMTGRSIFAAHLTGRLLRPRRREQSRRYQVLASISVVAFGTFLAMTSMRLAFPMWPALVALLAYGSLAIAAHLQRADV